MRNASCSLGRRTGFIGWGYERRGRRSRFCCRANWARRLFEEIGVRTPFGELHPFKRLYVQTMEAFEVRDNGGHVPAVERGIVGLRHDEHDAASPGSFNDIAGSILAETGKRGLTMLFSIWTADRKSFRPASP